VGTEYTADFYGDIADGCRRSAEIIAPKILDRFDVETVIDIGCGQAWWGSQFRRNGCRVTGIDGPYVTVPEENLDSFIAHDLGQPFPEVGRFDLAVCLEVAEHLPEARANALVAELCIVAPVVLFSAAIPHQSGAGHINCQWQSWWAEKFHANRFSVDGSIRFEVWDDNRVEPWYRQNLLVCSRSGDDVGPFNVVHPVIHEWGR
jgi:SAM-dependent methyltransferase